MRKYNPLLGKHYLKELNNNRWYLSPKIENEFINIFGDHKKDLIRKANYFSIILKKSDISHSFQILFISRNVVVEDKEVEVRESFLGFITQQRKTAFDIKKRILDKMP